MPRRVLKCIVCSLGRGRAAALTLDDQANSLDDLDHNHFHERVRVVVQLLLHSSTFATC